jgi:hypothetical protein
MNKCNLFATYGRAVLRYAAMIFLNGALDGDRLPLELPIESPADSRVGRRPTVERSNSRTRIEIDLVVNDDSDAHRDDDDALHGNVIEIDLA